ncbi:tRNA (adenine(58)-N(1))-methyltransferase catalytic subunit TRMT61A-like [Dysidea avara]|uniref:tRNA (adenine(58)-N(1))-methyltransferase catalytic subunit TRMT61A-like n=1 Tax=Dysidea avara TaxID=196820 RepID=UPI00331BC8D3
MSFRRYSSTVAEGDTVIICRGLNQVQAVRVAKGDVIQVQGGAIKSEDLLGKQYGSKVYTSNGKQWVLILHPTSEWWTRALPHRTQILYTTDISMIVLQLELRSGSVVCECGTGSGSLSHAILRTIAPIGHLYTYDFHQQRVNLAREEFTAHGLQDLVTVECRDVCSDGFSVEDVADAVFLDIPSPWDAIEAGKRALRASEGGRICCFSPCIEQVQQTCVKLEQVGFTDIEVMECVHRPINVRQSNIKTANLGLRHVHPVCKTSSTSAGPVSTTSSGLVNPVSIPSSTNAEPVSPVSLNSLTSTGPVSATSSACTIPVSTSSSASTGLDNPVCTGTSSNAELVYPVSMTSSTRIELVESGTTDHASEDTMTPNNMIPATIATTTSSTSTTVNNTTTSSATNHLYYPGQVTITTAQPATNITGHTGYLTFATLNPQ